MEAERLGGRRPFLDRPERHAQLGEIEGVLHRRDSILRG
jgi:hypothetical protein